MGKTIVITGASSGIGRATALHFQARGWNVVATMRKPEAATELASLDRVVVTRLDVLEDDSITSARDTALEHFGSVDVLLNNAGYGAYGPLEAFSMDRIRRQFDTNVIGLLAVVQVVLNGADHRHFAKAAEVHSGIQRAGGDRLVCAQTFQGIGEGFTFGHEAGGQTLQQGMLQCDAGA